MGAADKLLEGRRRVERVGEDEVGEGGGTRGVAAGPLHHAEAHAPGFECEHAPELTAPEDTDPDFGSWIHHGFLSSRSVELRQDAGLDLRPLVFAERLELRREFAIAGSGEHRHGKEGGVDRASVADRKGGGRDTGGHLHDREERVDPVERARFHRHGEHRQGGDGRSHTRQVGGAAGTGDQALEPAIGGGSCIVVEQPRGAVGADDTGFPDHPEVIQGARAVLQSRPVRLAAHDDSDTWRGLVHAMVDRPKWAAINQISAGGSCGVSVVNLLGRRTVTSLR